MILYVARIVPLIAPNLSIASIAYSEHDGVNRQLCGRIGEINLRYSFMKNLRIFFIVNNHIQRDEGSCQILAYVDGGRGNCRIPCHKDYKIALL